MLQIKYKIMYLVEGLPGIGKTRYLINHIFLHRKDADRVLFVTPLRRLRDEVFESFANLKMFLHDRRDLLLLQAKDEELCKNWKGLYDFINQIRIKYGLDEPLAWFLSHYYCENHCQLKNSCPYYLQFKNILRSKRKIVVTTYKMAFPLLLIQKWDIVVFDEFESLLYILNDAYIHKSFLYKLPEFIQREIKKRMEEYGDYYVMTLKMIQPGEIYITSASPLTEFIKVLKKEEKIKEINLNKKYVVKDRIIVVEPLYENIVHLRYYIVYNLLYKSEWFKNKKVGIVSPSKLWTDKYTRMIKSEGYPVINDLNGSSYRDSRKNNVVITIKGKWYRGVNVADKDVTVGIFQRQNPDAQFYLKNPWLVDRIEDREAFQEEIVLAENFQALFRVNRNRRKQHLMLVDTEMYKALYRFTRWRPDDRVLVSEIPQIL